MLVSQSTSYDPMPARTARSESDWKDSRAHAWYACYTASRREKSVAVLLRRRGIESFLPLVERERQWHDRRKVVPFPLFPSYVFARFSPEDTLPIVTTPGLATILRFDGRLASISDLDIENIARFARALSENRLEPPAPVPFAKGDWVRIASGPFEGVGGVVVELRGKRRVLVGLRTIGLAFEVDVPATCLKASSRPGSSNVT